jgi:hypothetical protein
VSQTLMGLSQILLFGFSIAAFRLGVSFGSSRLYQSQMCVSSRMFIAGLPGLFDGCNDVTVNFALALHESHMQADRVEGC